MRVLGKEAGQLGTSLSFLVKVIFSCSAIGIGRRYKNGCNCLVVVSRAVPNSACIGQVAGDYIGYILLAAGIKNLITCSRAGHDACNSVGCRMGLWDFVCLWMFTTPECCYYLLLLPSKECECFPPPNTCVQEVQVCRRAGGTAKWGGSMCLERRSALAQLNQQQ